MNRRALPPRRTLALPPRRLLALPPAAKDRNPPKYTHTPVVAVLGLTLAAQSLLDGSPFIESYYNASMVLSVAFLFVVLAAGWLRSCSVAGLARNWFALGAWTLWAAIGIFTVRDPMIHFKWLAIVWAITTGGVVFGATVVAVGPTQVAKALLVANVLWLTANYAMLTTQLDDLWTWRLSGAVLNRNSMAVNTLVLVTPLLYYMRVLRGPGRVLALALIALAAALIFMSLSRKGVAGLAFVLLCYGVFTLKGALARVSALMILLGAVAVLLITRNPFSARVTYVKDPGGEQVDVRMDLAQGGLSVGAEHAWLGVGLGHSVFYFGTYTHSNYVEMLMSTGAVGAITYYAPLLWLGWRLARSRRRDHLWAMALTLLCWKLLVNDIGVVSYHTASLVFSLAWVGAIALRPQPPLLPERRRP